MKYIKLFESFNKISESLSDDVVFDWLPFDGQENNPINSQIPQEVSYNDLPKIFENMGDQIVNAGIYIAHKKLDDGNFARLITDKNLPLTYTITNFDKEFKKIAEHKGVKSEGLDYNKFMRGSDIVSRFRF